MKLTQEPDSGDDTGLCKLSFDEDLTIYSIDALKQEVSEVLDTYDRFELNLASVEEIDSAGIQMLLALRTELGTNNKELKITAVSGVVAKMIEMYEVGDRFDMGEVA
jgi:anti-sigma B factor antagonist